MSSTRFRHQGHIVHSLYAHPPDQPTLLSRYSFPTGLTQPPPREMPSSSIHSLSGVAFHPNEMIVGLGGPDGIIRIMGCKVADVPDGAIHRESIYTFNHTQNGHMESIRSGSS